MRKKNELAIGMYRCDQHEVLLRSELTLSTSEGWSDQLTILLTLTHNLLRSRNHKYWGHTKFPSMNIANIFFSYKTLYDTFNKYIAKILFITRQIYKHRQEYIYKRHSQETVILLQDLFSTKIIFTINQHQTFRQFIVQRQAPTSSPFWPS